MAGKVIDDGGASGTAGIEEPIEDEFEAAFDSAETGVDEADHGTAAVETVVVVDPDDETVVVDDAGTAATAAPDTSVDVDDEDFEQKWKTLQGIHKHDKGSWDTEKATLLQQVEDAKKVVSTVAPLDTAGTAGTQKTAAQQAFVDSLTEDQKDQLKEYDREFDVVSKMEGLKRKVEFDKLRGEMTEWKEGVLARIDEQGALIDPVLQRTEVVEEGIHFNKIKDVHSDLDEHRDSGALLTWIESKPNYLKTSMLETYNNGEADDVIELITDFKTENNINTPENEEDDPLKIAANELKEKRRKKKEALRAVKTRPNAVNVAKAAIDDYEGAFEEASGTE
jgi:hypothetical protein